MYSFPTENLHFLAPHPSQWIFVDRRVQEGGKNCSWKRHLQDVFPTWSATWIS